MEKRLILSAVNVAKSFGKKGQEVRALCGIDLNIYEGEFISIMGPSGAGKSTLMSVLSGLDGVTQGEVIYEGKSIYSLKDEEIAGYRGRDIGIVFQKDNLIEELTVIDNIMISSGLYGNNEKIIKLLEVLGIKEKEKAFPRQLSGGQAQKVAIARALINKPKILFLDEPTGNLDRQSGEDLMELLLRLSEKGQTIVLITHDMEAAVKSSKIYFQQDGVIKKELCLGKYRAEEEAERKSRIFEMIN